MDIVRKYKLKYVYGIISSNISAEENKEIINSINNRVGMGREVKKKKNSKNEEINKGDKQPNYKITINMNK